MASTRKPTYKPATDTGQPTAGRPRSKDSGTVISAQRSLEPGVTPAVKSTGSANPVDKNSKSGKATPPGNVIAFPEPKGKRQRRLVLWTISIVAAFVAALIAGAVYSPVLAVRTVTVDGTTLLTPDAVQKALSELEGKPLPQVSEQEINELLKPLVQVRSATMEARPPSELLVHVNERVPVALLKQGDSFVMVDVDGVQLGATKDQSAVALPLIDAGAGATNTELFKAIAAVLDTLPADVLARMSTASAASADAVELKLVDGKTVVWGNAEDRELKAKALEALLKMPADPKVPVRVYDVSVPRHPFTK
ncbi:FtsQ-type POTRA domain-containing protein [Paenarthrobacter nitroguajacolicus]|uniref:FtsQ-type POTRA domain-containing protein n=1 Tax=Paenarthrobacter nitroguajacolicus TaxID=211146 RepID=A0A558GQI3_PAENT|nr:FtsQ-type POTRA domain-containing protein [Paenarthrobacter nitroguajacolicus]TVU59076.1 FtsQ-type POTRA domain-containing protein [Paenarthrobacter nitroguajacolicus]